MSGIVIAGALANKPFNGGAAWTRLSWLLGFRRLGYEVCFVEQISPTTCVDQSGRRCAIEQSINAAYFMTITRQFGVDAALVLDRESRTIGLPWDALVDIADAADMLVNISGHLTVEALKTRFRKRIFVDLDPGYTQFWHTEGLAEDRLRGHDLYFTVGENIGRAGCGIPGGGITWQPIRQPVVLDDWPVTRTAMAPTRFTTVASWRGPIGRARLHDRTFGVKAHEFRKFMSLPTLADSAFEIALDVDPADAGDVRALQQNGWSIVNPQEVVPDPITFREYVQGSSAEFSVAQGVYVETGSGWFSDRTVRYLASGKPALVQDTGWTRHYPHGLGLMAFRTLNEAVAGAEHIARDYSEHARAARAVAEAFFDSSKVLSGLLAAVERPSTR